MSNPDLTPLYDIERGPDRLHTGDEHDDDAEVLARSTQQAPDLDRDAAPTGRNTATTAAAGAGRCLTGTLTLPPSVDPAVAWSAQLLLPADPQRLSLTVATRYLDVSDSAGVVLGDDSQKLETRAGGFQAPPQTMLSLPDYTGPLYARAWGTVGSCVVSFVAVTR